MNALCQRRIAATVRRMVFFGESIYLDSMDFAISFTVSGAMLNVLHWIHIGSNAYDEYTFVP
ncbi:hypothetical protein OKW41_001119 [Paraburkholderia sp. UCT70]